MPRNHISCLKIYAFYVFVFFGCSDCGPDLVHTHGGYSSKTAQRGHIQFILNVPFYQHHTFKVKMEDGVFRCLYLGLARGNCYNSCKNKKTNYPEDQKTDYNRQYIT